MVYIGGLPRREGMALAKATGRAERVTFGMDRHLPLVEKIAALDAVFDEERVPAGRRPFLLGVLLGITRANGESQDLADLYAAAGADPQAAAAQEAHQRDVLSGWRGGPRH
ncbi:hypothetical protein AB0J82_36540 [Asanoa sp. NPDC049518]|uniref:hypothetical protein n=1 Tax=unclassified Asanoa TaxID=2685164 RepID=UPI003427643F